MIEKIYSNMEDFLLKRKFMYLDKVKIKYKDEPNKLKKANINIETDYLLDLEKVKFIKESLLKNPEKQDAFIKANLFFIEEKEEGIDPNNVIDGILAYGLLLFESANDITKFSNEEAYLIASTMSQTWFENIYEESMLFTNIDIISKVNALPLPTGKKRKILYDIADHFYELDEDKISFDEIVEEVLKSLEKIEKDYSNQKNNLK